MAISIHAPTRGATIDFWSRQVYGQPFQSTHPHGVRLGLLQGSAEIFKISIHAPTRGATTAPDFRDSRLLAFQSTHPHGVRLYKILALLQLSPISIHAPTRGATIILPPPHSRGRISIHAPTRGATYHQVAALARMDVFQSTHPHGVRQINPIMSTGLSDISIHAPTRGATMISVTRR